MSESSDPSADASREQLLAGLEAALGHSFRDRALLATALRHASLAQEGVPVVNNERLEFLGDSVIGLVVAHRLFDAHPDWEEGDLTRALHRLVRKGALADLARRFDLGSCLELGRTERVSGGADKTSILGDAMEAVLGALYLDGGLEPVQALVGKAFADAFVVGAPRVGRDAKTELQEAAVAVGGVLPAYSVEHDSGNEGDETRFTVVVRLRDAPGVDGIAGRGVGRSKRAAEREAAERALEALAAAESLANGESVSNGDASARRAPNASDE